MSKEISVPKIISLCLTAVVLVSATIWAFAGTYATAGHAQKAVVELKIDGCNPAQAVKERVIVLETRWESVEKSQTAIMKGQETILEELRK